MRQVGLCVTTPHSSLGKWGGQVVPSILYAKYTNRKSLVYLLLCRLKCRGGSGSQ